MTDLIVMNWAGTIADNSISAQQLYFVRTVKFVLIMTIFTLGVYANIYRQDITMNFAKRVSVREEEANKQPLL